MTHDAERRARALEAPVVAGLPDVPGIIAAMRLSPGLEVHLRGLADQLLVKEFPGATLSRAERELIATVVSAENECFYCMDSHGAFAAELLLRDGATDAAVKVDAAKTRQLDAFTPKMHALLHLARTVQGRSRDVTRADVERATAAGASDGDTQLTVLIASAFCMYNRMVDGLRAKTPPTADAFVARAKEIAEHGYSDARVQSIPGAK